MKKNSYRLMSALLLSCSLLPGIGCVSKDQVNRFEQPSLEQIVMVMGGADALGESSFLPGGEDAEGEAAPIASAAAAQAVVNSEGVTNVHSIYTIIYDTDSGGVESAIAARLIGANVAATNQGTATASPADSGDTTALDGGGDGDGDGDGDGGDGDGESDEES